MFEPDILSRGFQLLFQNLENLIVSGFEILQSARNPTKSLSADETLTRIMNELNIEINDKDAMVLVERLRHEIL